MLRKIFLLGLNFFNLAGAKPISVSLGQSVGLRLNLINKIGPRGAIVEVSRDKFISRSIRRYGEWEIAISEFLASEILALSGQKKVLLLDIGANVGIITVQASQILRKRGLEISNLRCMCIEPVSTNYDFCVKNLQNLVGKSINWEVLNLALGDSDANSVIQINNENFGDSSLLSSSHRINTTEESVKVVDTRTFSQEYLSSYDSIVMKCDTQGYDAKILARIPVEIWNLVSALVVEIESFSGLDESDLEICLERFVGFDSCSFSASGQDQVSAKEIREVWTSESHVTKNLYLSRTLRIV